MNFRDYKHFNNPRGLRNNGPYTALDAARYTDAGMGWAKLMVGGSEHVAEVRRLLGHDCMPIVQVYRERMGAAPADDGWWDIYQRYFEAGVMWFEFYDEPNAPHFWPADAPPSWHDTARCIAPLMDNWLGWAERIVRMGAYPAFPAMAETTVPEQATTSWLEASLTYLAQHQSGRFGKLIASGLWCATHPFLLNHFYQEPPGGPPTAARPYYQQSRHEGGWHFEYPYDPLQQHDDPGRTPFGGTARAPFGDPNGLVCSGEVFTELINRLFAAGPVPVIGTAGGITPIPGPNDEPVQVDTRYQGYSRDSHGEATAALFRWMAEMGPPWLLGLTLSSEADYFPGGLAVPAMVALASDPPLLREPANLEIREGHPTSAVQPADELDPLLSGVPSAHTAPPPPMPADLFMPEPLVGEPLVGEQSAPPAGPADETDKFLDELFAGTPFGAAATPDSEPFGDPYAALRPQQPEPEPAPLMAGPFDDPYTAQAPDGEEEKSPPPEQPDEVTPPGEEEEKSPPPDQPEKETPPPAEPEEGTPPPRSEQDEAEEERLIPEDEIFPEMNAAMDRLLGSSGEPAGPEPAADDESPAPTSLWPAPEAVEEVHTPLPEPAQPAPEPDETPSPTSLWPAPEAQEEAPVSPPMSDGEAGSAPLTVLWPAPEAVEEVHTPTPSAPAAPSPAVAAVKPQAVVMAAPARDEKLGPGPGKFADIVSDHWLMPAPGLPVDWLFGSARRYWEAFRVPIVSDPGLIGVVPPGHTLAVTLVTSKGAAQDARQTLAAEWPNVRIDVVTGDTQADIQTELDRRARELKEFG